MMPDFRNFACDNCGACCKLIVEASYQDAQREPALYQIGQPDHERFRQGDSCIMLWDQDRECCPFLDVDNKCGIYATRPLECVAVEPGDAKCQQARRMAGLGLLRDKDGNEPSRELLEQSCEEYDLDLSEVLE